MGKDNLFELSAKAVLVFFALAFFIYPLAAMLLKAFVAGGFERAVSIILSKQNVIFSSFLQAAISTIFSLFIGIPAAYILARRSFAGKNILRSISLLPFVFPSVLVVLSFVIVFGNNGWVNTLLRALFGFAEPVQFIYGFWGVVLAHVFYNFPLVMLFVANAWGKTDSQMIESARSLGAGKLAVFSRIVLPQLLPSIAASATLVFIYCFMSFAIVLSLGGPQLSTIEVEIYYQISRNLDFGAGAILGLFQFAMLCVLALVYFFLSHRFFTPQRSVSPQPEKFELHTLRGKMELLFLCATVLFIIVPLLSIVIFAFVDQRTGAISMRSFEKIFFAGSSLSGATGFSSIFYSLFIALVASIVATLMGLLSSLRDARIPLVTFLPGSSIAVSTITLGLGYLVGFGSGNILIIAIGHSVLAFPFAYRLIGNALGKIEQGAIDAAKTLGADSLEIFRKIQFPRIKSALLVSLAFSFAVSLGELAMVMLLYDGIYPTMPVYIYRLISVFDISAAAAMGVILIGVSFLCFYVIEHFSNEVSVF